jgi:hypothetical protein
MASPFDDLDALVSGAVASAFGEAAVITPRSAQQYAARTQDTNRAQRSCSGIFSAGPGADAIRGQTVGSEFAGGTRVSSVKAEFWLTKTEIEALGFTPAKGDTVSFPARSGAPVYAITAVQHTAHGDVALLLVREDQSA